MSKCQPINDSSLPNFFLQQQKTKMRTLFAALLVIVLLVSTILAGGGNPSCCRTPVRYSFFFCKLIFFSGCHGGGGVTTLSHEDEEFLLSNADLEEEVVSVLRSRVRFPTYRTPKSSVSSSRGAGRSSGFASVPRASGGAGRGSRSSGRGFKAAAAAGRAGRAGRGGRSSVSGGSRGGNRRGGLFGGKIRNFIGKLKRDRPVARAITNMGKTVFKRWQKNIATMKYQWEKHFVGSAPRSSKYSADEQKEQDWWWNKLEEGNIILPDGKCATSCDWFLLKGSEIVFQLNINTTKADYDPDNICVECDKRWIVYKGPCHKFPAALQDGSISHGVAEGVRQQCFSQSQGSCQCDKKKITPDTVSNIRLRVRKSGVGNALKSLFKNFGKVIGKAFKAVGKAVKAVGKAVGRLFRGIGRGVRRLFRRL